ncbi:44606_t:CDS:1, partial [Gigaspora margarita]
KNITDKFANEWKKEIEKYKVGKKPSLLKALDRTIGWHFWCSLFTRLIGSFLQSISPLIMQ